MDTTSYREAILLLADGSIYRGRAAGKIGTTFGEICFNTGMTGYQEIFTDPSYFGQVLVATNAHIGNYGVKDSDVESERMQIAGLVCKNFTDMYNRPLADSSIQQYFEEGNMVCIHGVDTRSIVKHIRDKGAMNAIISSEVLDIDELKKMLSKVPSMEGLELASKVSTKEAYVVGPDDAELRIAALDFGMKKNITQCLVDRGCQVKIFPAETPYSVLAEYQPDGYFLSNGPGDPASMQYAVDTTKQILASQEPVFGICLGHQILALAAGVPTYKMHHGHRGINHPVMNIKTGKCEITSQNHGFGVAMDAIYSREEDIEVTHVNLNDQTIEGIHLKKYPAFSVQYHPESSPGPHDSRYLFDEFLEMIKSFKNQKIEQI